MLSINNTVLFVYHMSQETMSKLNQLEPMFIVFSTHHPESPASKSIHDFPPHRSLCCYITPGYISKQIGGSL